MKSDLLRHLRSRVRSGRDLRYSVQTMRQALASPGGHVHIGPAGVGVEFINAYGGASRLSGYGLDHVMIALPLIALGLPTIDTRPCEAWDDFIAAVLAAPLCAVDGTPDPLPDTGQWHGLSHAPLGDLIAHWRRHGAAIINWQRAEALPMCRTGSGSGVGDVVGTGSV